MNITNKTKFDYGKHIVILAISGPACFMFLVFMLLIFAYLKTIGILDPTSSGPLATLIHLLVLIGFGVSYIGMLIVFPVTLIKVIFQIIRSKKK